MKEPKYVILDNFNDIPTSGHAKIESYGFDDDFGEEVFEEHYFSNNNLHRFEEFGPAIKYSNGYQEWVRYGHLHRESGPAIVYQDESGEYWLGQINIDVIYRDVI